MAKVTGKYFRSRSYLLQTQINTLEMLEVRSQMTAAWKSRWGPEMISKGLAIKRGL